MTPISKRIAVALAILLATCAARAAGASPAARVVPVAGTSAGWTPELLEDIQLGLAALPPGAQRFPGGDLEVELHAGPAPFGVGDGSPSRPELTDGLRRLHLYAYAEPDEPRALARLSRLPAAAQRRLWRRRAIVHAVIRRWDEHLRWSRRPAWRRIAGWLSPSDRLLLASERALNVYDWAFSRRRGRDSAALDLATFAEEALVPAESLDPAAVPPDESVRCQEWSKSRFLGGVLADVERAGHPGARADPILPVGPCPAFDAWADLPTLSHLEVLFAAPSGARPESLFGHVLLRAVRRPGPMIRGPSNEPVLEIAAITGPAENLVEYLGKGATGGYLTVFSQSPLASIQQKNLEVDQRSLRRFRLALDRTEQRRVLERIWELERRGYFRYYFLDENCATMLIFLLEGALDEGRHIQLPGRLWVMPTAALDEIAHVTVEERAPDGAVRRAPLLVHLPDDQPSLRQLASEADADRTSVVRDLARLAPADVAARWLSLERALRGAGPRERLGAYQTLPALVEATLGPAGPTASSSPAAGESAEARRQRVWTFLLATLRIERYAAAVAAATRSEVEQRAIVVPAGLRIPTADEMVRDRQRQFQREDAEARREEDLDRTLAFEDLVASLPRRPLDAGARARLADADAASATFTRFTEIHATLVDRHFADVDVGATLAAEQAEARERAAARDRRSPAPSGFGRLGIAAGASGGRGVATAPVLVLRTAVLAEQLGDQRQRGFGAGTELRLADSEIALSASPSGPEVRAVDVTVLRFRTLAREPPSLRRGFADRLGWEMGLTTSWGRHAAAVGRSGFDLGWLAVLGSAPGLERLTLLGLGVAAQADTAARWPSALALGPRLSLVHRSPLGGSLANAWRLEASYVPRLGVLGEGAGRLGHVADLRTGIDVLAGTARTPLLIGPRLVAGWERLAGETEVHLSATLAVEMP